MVWWDLDSQDFRSHPLDEAPRASKLMAYHGIPDGMVYDDIRGWHACGCWDCFERHHPKPVRVCSAHMTATKIDMPSLDWDDEPLPPEEKQ